MVDGGPESCEEAEVRLFYCLFTPVAPSAVVLLAAWVVAALLSQTQHHCGLASWAGFSGVACCGNTPVAVCGLKTVMAGVPNPRRLLSLSVPTSHAIPPQAHRHPSRTQAPQGGGFTR